MVSQTTIFKKNNHRYPSIMKNLIERICLIFSVTEYFKGNNWKVHPDWVYCEYSSASEKWFPSPEERVLHFLTRTRSPGWKWMSLRPRSPSSHHKQASKPDKDAYYCMYLSRSNTMIAQYRVYLRFKITISVIYEWIIDDFAGDKKLVQSLVLDALVTDGFNKRGAMHKEENQK